MDNGETSRKAAKNPPEPRGDGKRDEELESRSNSPNTTQGRQTRKQSQEQYIRIATLNICSLMGEERIVELEEAVKNRVRHNRPE